MKEKHPRKQANKILAVVLVGTQERENKTRVFHLPCGVHVLFIRAAEVAFLPKAFLDCSRIHWCLPAPKSSNRDELQQA